jgi:uridine kinase
MSLSFEDGVEECKRSIETALSKEASDGVVVIAVSGPSGAGKTHFADALKSYFNTMSLRHHAAWRQSILSLDNYMQRHLVCHDNFDHPHLPEYPVLTKNINVLLS